jgi:hypothetical protein
VDIGEFEIRAVAVGLLFPAAVCSALLFAFTAFARRWRGMASFAGPIALALSIWAGFFGLKFGSFFPDDSGWVWLPHLAAIAVPAAWIAAYSQRRWLALAVGVVVAVIGMATVIRDWPIYAIDPQKTPAKLSSNPTLQLRTNLGQTAALAEGVVLVAIILLRVAPLLPKSANVLAMMATIGTVSSILFAGHNAVFAQTAGAATAALGGAALIVAILGSEKGEIAVRGLIPGFAIILIGFLYAGYDNSFETRLLPCYPLAAFSPIALTIVLIPAIRRQTEWFRARVSLVALAIPLAMAATWAAVTFLSDG